MQAHVAISNWQHTFWSYIWTPYIVQSIPAFFPRLSSYLRFTSSTMSCTYCDDKGVKKYVCFFEQDWQTQILPEALGWESSKVLETSSPRLFATWEVSFWGDGRHNIKYDFEACIQNFNIAQYITHMIRFKMSDSRYLLQPHLHFEEGAKLTHHPRVMDHLRFIHDNRTTLVQTWDLISQFIHLWLWSGFLLGNPVQNLRHQSMHMGNACCDNWLGSICSKKNVLVAFPIQSP